MPPRRLVMTAALNEEIDMHGLAHESGYHSTFPSGEIGASNKAVCSPSSVSAGCSASALRDPRYAWPLVSNNAACSASAAGLAAHTTHLKAGERRAHAI